MTNKMAVVVLAVAALAVAALLWVSLSGDPVPERKRAHAKKSLVQDAVPGKKSVRKNKPLKMSAKGLAQKGDRKKGKRPVRRMPAVDAYSPADRKLADAVQSALDDENLEQTRKAAGEAMRSVNPDVRQEAVDALGWFDDKALVDLTKAMSDKDRGVAESARGHVENALMGMEDDDRAFVLAAEYVKLFAEDEEAVTMFTGVLSSTGSRIIDPDDSDSAEDVEKAKGNRAGIVDIVEEMIRKGGKLAEKGHELYEDITGDKWTDRAAADAWANDIEEPKQEEPEREDQESEEPASPES